MKPKKQSWQNEIATNSIIFEKRKIGISAFCSILTINDFILASLKYV